MDYIDGGHLVDVRECLYRYDRDGAIIFSRPAAWDRSRECRFVQTAGLRQDGESGNRFDEPARLECGTCNSLVGQRQTDRYGLQERKRIESYYSCGYREII